jgi:hypothetical protein
MQLGPVFMRGVGKVKISDASGAAAAECGNTLPQSKRNPPGKQTSVFVMKR